MSVPTRVETVNLQKHFEKMPTSQSEAIPSIYPAPRRLAPSRGARRDTEDLDSATGKLGADFQGVDCLLIPEVKLLLDMHKRRRMQSGIERPSNEVFEKTLEYCSRFTAFSNPNTVRHIKSTIDSSQYEPFEIGLMGNLGIESVEEARSLIPSLNRETLDDNTIHSTLNDLQNLKKYQAAG
ncbi:DNA-directed RNA polymerase II subunit RPB4 [Spizellomyces punctatus DAOM BR117]|uniref:RNA polymerase Rpb4/RPC9 core domain-containing protein n=1 Tax=Spizellomyces punctatus (strain DAOM BR117) TaxID=645134 RepID=A0A0L0HUM9_SPIPD|nr:DNA-directed RNA polymerase II subunit RPB4 [Spizellomyces punctatus DAOM BR117]KND04807.1 hypothetical protein SPPG_00510 [Spizellomyces punctatus DAOM BR117]|eukprot:XP_016612846.1 hypothetical protein SPPG_00510 [Spizellomyces punctatus DAOM BR117]